MNLLKMCGPQIRLCLFTFRHIAKQLNSLTTIKTLSWLGGLVVTLPHWEQEVQGSIPRSGKYFYAWYFVLLLLLWFYFFIQNTLFVTKFAISFVILINLVFLTYCKNYDN